MLRFVVLTGLLLAGSAQAATTVADDNGNVVCMTGGARHQITNKGVDRDSVLSPDGHTVAFIRTTKKAVRDLDPDWTELWIGDCATGKARLLLGTKPSKTPEHDLTSFNDVAFSLNGGYVYVLSTAWVTSDAVHQVNIKTGKEKFITGSNTLQVIRNGPYAGYLLLQKHEYYTTGEGGSYDPTYVYRPDGKWKMMVPNTNLGAETDMTEEWLKAKGWIAN
jgi:hypothetical protein